MQNFIIPGPTRKFEKKKEKLWNPSRRDKWENNFRINIVFLRNICKGYAGIWWFYVYSLQKKFKKKSWIYPILSEYNVKFIFYIIPLKKILVLTCSVLKLPNRSNMLRRKSFECLLMEKIVFWVSWFLIIIRVKIQTKKRAYIRQ